MKNEELKDETILSSNPIEPQDNVIENTESQKKETPKAPKSNKKGVWTGVAAGAAGGIALGVTATLLTNAAIHRQEGSSLQDSENEVNANENTSEQDAFSESAENAGELGEDMSFAEAFAEAREEVGAGGYFEWNGVLYSTYTADEWASMSPEEQANYSNQAISGFQADNGYVADATSDETNEDSGFVDYVTGDEIIPEDEMALEDGAVDEPVQGNPIVAEQVDGEPVESEIEVLGVYHDDEDNSNVGSLMVDNQEVYLIDVDNNQVFDYAFSDANKDDEIQDDEIIDIQNENITVADLGGETPQETAPSDDMVASNDNVEPDYVNDAEDVYEA